MTQTEIVNAEQKFKTCDLNITSVTVYSDRAEVKRRVKTTLEMGMNKIIVEDIPRTANKDSVIVNGYGDAVIHEVQINDMPILSNECYLPRLQELKIELDKFEEERKRVEDRKKIVARRLELLDTFVEKGGSADVLVQLKDGGNGLSGKNIPGNIMEMLDFHEKEHAIILEEKRKVDKNLMEIDEQIEKLRKQISETNSDSKHIRNICILLESAAVGVTELDVCYQVFNASWHPAYEIRVQSMAKTLKLTYFGILSQCTGEDWMNAMLVLSTTKPSLGGMVPRLGTLNAEFQKPPPIVSPRMLMGSNLAKSQAYCMSTSESYESEAVAPALAHAPVNLTTAGMSTMFAIARRASISTGSSEHKVVIGVLDLKPELYYETVPSKCTNVYQTAIVVNDSILPLLPGEASIYVDNSFIAKNYMKFVFPGERFKCALGVERAIKIEYKPIRKYTEQGGLITRSVSTMNEQKILLKNSKSSDVLIAIREHVPKSTDEKIKIKLFSPEVNGKDVNARTDLRLTTGARLDEDHNLEWLIMLEAKREEELTIKWSVEYPVGQTVIFHEVFSRESLD